MAPEGGYRDPDGEVRGDERQRQISEIPSTSGLNGALMGAMPRVGNVTGSSHHRCLTGSPRLALRTPPLDRERAGSLQSSQRSCKARKGAGRWRLTWLG